MTYHVAANFLSAIILLESLYHRIVYIVYLETFLIYASDDAHVVGLARRTISFQFIVSSIFASHSPS